LIGQWVKSRYKTRWSFKRPANHTARWHHLLKRTCQKDIDQTIIRLAWQTASPLHSHSLRRRRRRDWATHPSTHHSLFIILILYTLLKNWQWRKQSIHSRHSPIEIEHNNKQRLVGSERLLRTPRCPWNGVDRAPCGLRRPFRQCTVETLAELWLWLYCAMSSSSLQHIQATQSIKFVLLFLESLESMPWLLFYGGSGQIR
jgi:hypothetical protein